MSKLNSIEQSESNDDGVYSLDWMGRIRNELKNILNPDSAPPQLNTDSISDLEREKVSKSINQVEDSVLGKIAFIDPKFPLF